MRLALAVIGLATVAFTQLKFIPIGGGSGVARPRIPDFGEPFTPSVIDPNDASFQPANMEGNRPNPIPVFPKSQQAGTPHEAPVDFTFTHQHPYKDPFRSDQFVGDWLTIPVGAARPNIPRTLGREMVYIDPRTNPYSELSRDEAEKKQKNMIFFGLSPPVEKLHRLDEFAPSSVPLQNPWDAWYDRFEEVQGLPRRQSPLTAEKRPTITRYPYYAADREKREAEHSTDAPEVEAELTTSTTTTTTSAPATTTILSDAIGSTTTIAALEATITADAAVVATTSASVVDDSTATTTTVKPTVAAAPTGTTPAPFTTTIIVSDAATGNATTPAAATTPLPLNLTTTAAPTIAASFNSKVVTVPSGKRLNSTRPAMARKSTVSTPLSKSALFEFRRRNATAIPPSPVVQRQRLFNHTKIPMRTTLANGAEKPAPTSVSRRPLAPLKLDNAVGTAKNVSGAITIRLPIRTTTFLRRPVARTRASLRKFFNATTTASPSTKSATASTKAGATPAAASSASSSAASSAAAAAANTTTVPTTTPAIVLIGTSKAASNRTTVVSTRTKAPFRVFSKRPLATSKLPARTPIVTDISKVGEAENTNNIGTLRDEVNRLLTTVVQLQSTVIAQQERIAHLESQLRRRRAAAKGNKTTRFVAPNGHTVERTMKEIRKSRSARMRQIVSQAYLRQRSNIA